MVIYFTGTGNSRYCAEAFAEAVQDALFDCFDSIRNKEPAVLHSDTPWIFCAPTSFCPCTCACLRQSANALREKNKIKL